MVSDEAKEFENSVIETISKKEFKNKLDKLYHKKDYISGFYLVEEHEEGFLAFKCLVEEKVEKDTGRSYFLPNNGVTGRDVLLMKKIFIEKENEEDNFEGSITKRKYQIIEDEDTILVDEDTTVGYK